MSIVKISDSGVLLDQGLWLDQVYSKVIVEEQCCHKYEFCKHVFDIVDKFKITNNKRNRKRKFDPEPNIEAEQIRKSLNEFLQLPLPKYDVTNTEVELLELSKSILDATSSPMNRISGGNNSDSSVKSKIGGDYFLIPPKSRFFIGCVKDVTPRLSGNTFNCVVADPPWWNKYIRRLKGHNVDLSYQMMYNEDIASLPIQELLEENVLIAVWCTNSPSNEKYLKENIFPAWGLEYVATWFWVKITKNFEPVCDFGGMNQKQPYERLLIGKRGILNREIEKERIIISVPSALHSNKPSLLELLQPYLDGREMKCLELFARYLQPNTTSVGFEVLKFQHICLYSKVDNA